MVSWLFTTTTIILAMYVVGALRISYLLKHECDRGGETNETNETNETEEDRLAYAERLMDLKRGLDVQWSANYDEDDNLTDDVQRFAAICRERGPLGGIYHGILTCSDLESMMWWFVEEKKWEGGFPLFSLYEVHDLRSGEPLEIDISISVGGKTIDDKRISRLRGDDVSVQQAHGYEG